MGLQELPKYTDSLRTIRERFSDLSIPDARLEFSAQYPGIREELSQIPIEGIYTQPRAIELLEQLYLFQGGWRQSENIREETDFDNYIEIEDIESAELPSSFSLREQFTPVEEQSTNACTAYAVTALLEYWGATKAIAPLKDTSALFLYKLTRLLIQIRQGNRNFGLTSQQDSQQIFTLSSAITVVDEGASFRDTFNILQKIGIVTEQNYPSNQTLQGIIQTEVWNGRFPVQDWTSFRLEPDDHDPYILLTKVKLCLVSGVPCVFGFKEFPILQSITDGTVPYKTKERIEELKQDAQDEIVLRLDGHALAAVGYDDTHNNGTDIPLGALLVRNSWGESWGDKGYAWFPYAYINDGQTLEWWSFMNTKELQDLAEYKEKVQSKLSNIDSKLALSKIEEQIQELAQLKWMKDGNSKNRGFGIVHRAPNGKNPVLGPPDPSGTNSRR
jgi:hypothetical protein